VRFPQDADVSFRWHHFAGACVDRTRGVQCQCAGKNDEVCDIHLPSPFEPSEFWCRIVVQHDFETDEKLSQRQIYAEASKPKQICCSHPKNSHNTENDSTILLQAPIHQSVQELEVH
jgi:hypothetical protein